MSDLISKIPFEVWLSLGGAFITQATAFIVFLVRLDLRQKHLSTELKEFKEEVRKDLRGFGRLLNTTRYQCEMAEEEEAQFEKKLEMESTKRRLRGEE
jgi:hypothetical protein